jgi:hypothetical protein
LNSVSDFFIPKGYSLVLKITLSQAFTEEITTRPYFSGKQMHGSQRRSDEKRKLLYAKVNSVNGMYIHLSSINGPEAELN